MPGFLNEPIPHYELILFPNVGEQIICLAKVSNHIIYHAVRVFGYLLFECMYNLASLGVDGDVALSGAALAHLKTYYPEVSLFGLKGSVFDHLPLVISMVV
jgi:hypothetical protein